MLALTGPQAFLTEQHRTRPAISLHRLHIPAIGSAELQGEHAAFPRRRVSACGRDGVRPGRAGASRAAACLALRGPWAMPVEKPHPRARCTCAQAFTRRESQSPIPAGPTASHSRRPPITPIACSCWGKRDEVHAPGPFKTTPGEVLPYRATEQGGETLSLPTPCSPRAAAPEQHPPCMSCTSGSRSRSWRACDGRAEGHMVLCTHRVSRGARAVAAEMVTGVKVSR